MYKLHDKIVNFDLERLNAFGPGEEGNNGPLQKFTNALVKLVEQLRQELNRYTNAFTTGAKEIGTALSKGDISAVSTACVKQCEKFNGEFEKFSLSGVLNTLKNWLAKVWQLLQSLPSTVNENAEKIKKAFKNIGTKIGNYWNTIINGEDKSWWQQWRTGANKPGVKEIWAKASQSYKVLFVIGIALLIIVLSYTLVKPDMIADAWNGFTKALSNIKSGIASAFRQGSFVGMLKGILNIFLAPFKVLLAGIDAIIDSGIGDLLSICLIIFGLACVFMYYKITGKVPFQESFQSKKISRMKMLQYAKQLESVR